MGTRNLFKGLYVTKKNGTIFRYDFVAGGQIVPKKCLHDRIEKDGWDGCQGQKFVRDSVYF
jgi:hypothetical protein